MGAYRILSAIVAALACIAVPHGRAPAGEALPPGAIARFGRAPLHHGTWLEQLAFSPDGRVLASSGHRCRPNDVVLWDPATGRRLHSLGGGELRLYAIAFFPDGRTLVSGSTKGEIHFWDVASGRETTRFRKPSDLRGSSISSLMGLAVSPDGRTVAVQSYSRIEVFDAVAGQRRFAVKDHYLGAFSPDGKLLAAAGRAAATGGFRLLDSATGKPVREMDSGERRGMMPTFSPDGTLLAAHCTAGKDARTIVLWETRTGRIVRELPSGLSPRRPLAFHPGGALLAAASWTDGVRIWSLRTGQLVGKLIAPGERTLGVAFSPDGRLLATANNNLPTGGPETAQIRLWDTVTWRQLPLTAAYRGPLLSAAASADGRRVLTGGPDGAARLWDGRTGKRLLCLPDHVQGAAAVAVSRDGRSLYTAPAGKGILRLWDGETGRLRREMSVPGGAGRGIALLPAGRRLAAFGAKGSASLIDLETGEARLFAQADETSGFTPALSADGRTAASTNGRLVHVWEVSSLRRIGRYSTPGTSYHRAIGLDPTGRLLAADCGRIVALLELDSGGTALAVDTRRRITQRGNRVAFSGDGAFFATAEAGGAIGLWSVRSGAKLGERRGHRGCITALEFLADGTGLLSGGSDGTAVLWTLADVTRAARAEKRKTDPDDLPRLWGDLASDDTDRAHEAIFRLIDAGDACPAFLGERLTPARGPAEEDISRRIAELGHDRFAVRERATAELLRLGPAAEVPLRRALAEADSAEIRVRAKRLLEALDTPHRRSGPVLRKLRAVYVLERIGSPKAVAVLRKLAGGSNSANLTRRAAAALERLHATQPRAAGPPIWSPGTRR